MPDLHDWITQQIDHVEAVARTAKPLIYNAFGEFYIAEAEAHLELHSPAAVLRRCEADRRILARHRMDPAKAGWSEATACAGCGVYSDCDRPVTSNINDCPELLDLAHAHGITEEDLATLDRPQSPPRQPIDLRRVFADAIRHFEGTSTATVPPALRGPNWKARP